MFGDRYQYALIGLGFVATLFLTLFFYRELFPEYKIYQKDFVALEEWRGSKAPFSYGIKQIVTEREDRGPPVVERCISCHVALQVPDYAATKVGRDPRGEILYDKDGVPVKVANEAYIWKRLDDEVARLRSEGKEREAQKLADLKIAKVGEFIYDVTKVLSAHPLIGKETRPFEYHSLEEYGCISCHNGNGQGLVTDRAHGPIFDGSYDTEYVGYKPQFLEKDEAHDPPISRIFNAKPGHRLLFQTTPLYLGPLIQAKCVSCHLSSPEKEPTEIDLLTKNYLRGEELYISQACYACHRIAGFARGGVGPDLTKEGNSYPWFVKESIVWPQADLKTSTMPNYKMDHEEIQDLLTFLLAQKGESPALSGSEYKSRIAEWDAGKKLSFEKSITADKIEDLDYGMTVFATEGCAACHRLKGFDSNVGYVDEKDREWFQKRFPEMILGSEIVALIGKYGSEIDMKLSPHIRQNSLLERLEKTYPGLILAYYAPFKYAERADRDPKFQERLHKVLMMYVQEYGLGRIVGPRPNWSGVYRSDTWLIEHFKNPAALSPRSIMPIFPFDDTKFFALTYMLDILGIRNRDQVRKIWDEKGFRPDEAFSIHCSQCHGEYMEGNGPVAEWIYPIPKNLKKAEFLRNLTRERAIDSIHHGVKGTPMPPWGEVAGEGTKDKPVPNTVPVLKQKEIEDLVDWLFSQIPGSEVIRGKQDVPKWQYTPEEVIYDLRREQKEEVSSIFDKKPNPPGSPDPFSYFIKKEYYTPENIASGEAFFRLNCATCHGNDADGMGLRAEALYDAKPRMLTNLEWSRSRDDLRLLRSIKYGVLGTAMTPWGDLTTAKQRLDLVVYIRSLSDLSKKRADFMSALYQAFDRPEQALQQARVPESQKLDKLERTLQEAEKTLASQETVPHFEAMLKAKQAFEAQNKIDQLWSKLPALLVREKGIYQAIGTLALAQETPEEFLGLLEEILKIEQHKISLNGDKILWTMTPEEEAKMEKLAKEIEQKIDSHPSKSAALSNFKRTLLSGMKEAKGLREEEKKIVHEIR